jgi:predicted ATPase
MLTKLTVRNFKRFGEVEIEMASPVVLIGPNNSGKTSALQALALWEAGLKKWNEKRREETPKERRGVTINRRDLVAVPVPNSRLLWNALHTRKSQKVEGKSGTENIRIDLIVEGITNDSGWKCGLEFDYGNDESIYCRPLRLSDTGTKNPEWMSIPEEAGTVNIAFLPPMSGLAANEVRLDPGAINVRVGEGRTAEVLRNLCYKICTEAPAAWRELKKQIASLFGSDVDDPEYVAERGEIVMTYREKDTRLDLSCSGRGLQQTLLLLSYMYANPGSVLLLDEPDAHLEILRQRQIYRLITEVARQNGSQIIAASHSEVLLNEAAEKDVVIAFLGKPHRIDDRGSQVVKSLKEIGFDHYVQAEQTGWVLYLEGATDLAILQKFAEKLQHEDAVKYLERPFVHYIANQPVKAQEHFRGLREAVPRLKGIAIFDRLDRKPPPDPHLSFLVWRRREIENYLCVPETLEAYARHEMDADFRGPLFSKPRAENRLNVMRETIKEIEKAMATLGKGSPWSEDTKASDEFLVPLFQKYFEKLNLFNVMAKKNFHELAQFVPPKKLDPEVEGKLAALVEVAKSAVPAPEWG